MSQEEQDRVLAGAVREHAQCQKEGAAIRLRLDAVKKGMEKAAIQIGHVLTGQVGPSAEYALMAVRELPTREGLLALLEDWQRIRVRELELAEAIETMK